ncbi:alpha/beta hydrolase [Nocardiopsis sp. NPDC006938]|uniref:alpha/beta hydrolase n=1 Tax=Nocardiopsis sp. NPDC006938 TaxID=3364337 RepID=UPI00367F8F38
MAITVGRVRWGAAAGVFALLLAGCTAQGDGDAAAAEPASGPREIDWAPCYTEEELEEAPEWDGDPEWLETLECGTLTVPVDHSDPDGDTLDLALARQPASGASDQRVGSLVVNPGGPGESGVSMLDHPLFADPVLEAFDLVGFDPRGVGGSESFACGDWYAMYDARQAVADPENVTDDDLSALEESARAYAEACAESVGEEFLANMGTVNVVRDLDLIRDALGDDRLTYAGFSYGTYIGALYADMYPENTRALVLDGAVETERPNVEVAADQAEAFQAAWEWFVDDCSYAPSCPFDGVDTADQRMEGILDRLDADPPTIRDTRVDGEILLSMVSMQLYDEVSWYDLAQTLAALDEDVDGARPALEELYDVTFGQQEAETEEGDEPEEPGVHEDTEAAMTAVNCADRDDPTDADVYRDAAQRAAADSPYFGADLVWEQLPCAYWVDTEEAPAGFTAPDAPPILVIGTLGDPATPYGWAEELADQLDTATLLTYEGAGHTAYGYGLECVDSPVDAYLLDGLVPETGLSCPAW